LWILGWAWVGCLIFRELEERIEFRLWCFVDVVMLLVVCSHSMCVDLCSLLIFFTSSFHLVCMFMGDVLEVGNHKLYPLLLRWLWA
jgi:hypothetical protein